MYPHKIILVFFPPPPPPVLPIPSLPPIFSSHFLIPNLKKEYIHSHSFPTSLIHFFRFILLLLLFLSFYSSLIPSHFPFLHSHPIPSLPTFPPPIPIFPPPSLPPSHPHSHPLSSRSPSPHPSTPPIPLIPSPPLHSKQNELIVLISSSHPIPSLLPPFLSSHSLIPNLKKEKLLSPFFPHSFLISFHFYLPSPRPTHSFPSPSIQKQKKLNLLISTSHPIPILPYSHSHPHPIPSLPFLPPVLPSRPPCPPCPSHPLPLTPLNYQTNPTPRNAFVFKF